MIEAIKTILNGLVSFIRTNRPNWAQNDPDALDYIKNRPFYEEAKFITEGDITDDNHILPEGKYELGEIYIVEVDGVQHQLEFMSVRSGEGNYYVGFNIRPGRYSVEVLDSTKPLFYDFIYTDSPADGLYSLIVYNITRPAHVRVFQRAIHKIDGKYLPTPTADTAGIIKADAAETTDIRPVRLGADGKLYSSGVPIFTTSGTGIKYTANVPKITKLVDGMFVVMVPHVKSTTYAPSLEINNLGEHSIYRHVSSQTGYITAAKYSNWLEANVPVLLMYTSGRWVACNFTKPTAEDLYGYVPVSSGGTGRARLTAGSYLVGNETSNVLLKTPSEVLDDIGAIPAPATAKVGQAIVVKAVDENGKPTEWETVDGRSDWSENDEAASGYIKNRPFYEETKTVTVENATFTVLDGFPVFAVGDTVTVNADGVGHSLVAYNDGGIISIGDTHSSIENGEGQLGWQICVYGEKVCFFSPEEHTVSYLGIFVHKIDDKFVNLGGFVRTFDYHFKNPRFYKQLYDDAGNACTLYTCDNIILPEANSQLSGFMSEPGFSHVAATRLSSCYLIGYVIGTENGSNIIVSRDIVIGLNTVEMEEIAAGFGFTHTTNPKA